VQREWQSYPHGVRRLVAVLVMVLVLDAIGTFGPTPVCDPGAPSIPCLSAVALATDSLPPVHADIASIRFYVMQCVGYCPLVVNGGGAVVIFYLTDHTRSLVAVWAEAGVLRARYEGSDAVQ
jgi:hypothetical protein